MTTDRVDVDEAFEDLLGFIKDNRGFDFTGYKRPSLRRRIEKRMSTLSIETFGDYHAYLEANADEFGELFDTILINVSAFFRDPQTWEYLAEEIVPRLRQRDVIDPIRVWSAGCATGQEAYTAAMVLVEALGDAAFRDRVKVYATDVDETALTQARHALYTERDLQAVPDDLRGRYFEPRNGDFAFRTDLRRNVIFGRHDLVRDPPISRVDLLLARNTLMYFNPRLQGKILADFHFALNDDGVLVLGKSEMLLTRTGLFQPVDLRRRVFAKATDVTPRRHRIPLRDEAGEARAREVEATERLLAEAGLESVPVAQVLIDAEGRLAFANGHARHTFGLGQSDVGRPLSDLEISYRPLELRSKIDELHHEHHSVNVRDVEWAIGGETHWFDVHVARLRARDGATLGVGVTFTDVTRYRLLQTAVETAKVRLETAYEELQSTSEELETTNEELQSTNEELETTNEELQSTNEELETMNEELQSTNEELETINDELRNRTDELHDVNEFLEGILGGVGVGVAVVDSDLVVRAWNPRAAELWGLREDEVVGHHFANLDIGLPVNEILPAVQHAAVGNETEGVEVAAVERRGRRIRCVIRPTPLRGSAGQPKGAIVEMEEALRG